jgi:hypothetical protein
MDPPATINSRQLRQDFNNNTQLQQEPRKTRNLLPASCRLADIQPVLLLAARSSVSSFFLVPSQEGINPFFISCLMSSLWIFISPLVSC